MIHKKSHDSSIKNARNLLLISKYNDFHLYYFNQCPSHLVVFHSACFETILSLHFSFLYFVVYYSFIFTIDKNKLSGSIIISYLKI